MAYVASAGHFVMQGVTTQPIVTGRPVVINSSGTWGDLPHVVPAPANRTVGVFAVLVPPDTFPRPTPEDMFVAKSTARTDVRYATTETFAVDDKRYFNVSPAVLPNFVIPSGWKVKIVKSCVVAVHSGAYTDSTDIRVAGNFVGVDSNNRWAYVTNAANAVGIVREFRQEENLLLIALF